MFGDSIRTCLVINFISETVAFQWSCSFLHIQQQNCINCQNLTFLIDEQSWQSWLPDFWRLSKLELFFGGFGFIRARQQTNYHFGQKQSLGNLATISDPSFSPWELISIINQKSGHQLSAACP